MHSRHTHRAVRSALRLATAAVLSLCTVGGAAQERYQYDSKVEIAFDRLYGYDEVVAICRRLVDAYPELLRMESVGKSVEGRDMWLVTLNNSRTGSDTSKPAMYIDANIHGNEVQGTEVVLYSIWYLTKSYGRVEHLTRLIDRAAFYFVPMINPDGRAHWFDDPNTMNDCRGGRRPVDNDGDGLFDEDPPNDIDGDGYILQMRREDPNGRMRESAEDYRLMVPVEPQAKGDFKRYQMLGSEGFDDDGDGLINEDGPGGYDPNRDWPAEWQPAYIQYGAGELPLSWPEHAGVAAFILAHPNIAAVQAYHNNGGMILRGPGAEYVNYPQPDVRVYDRIGQRGEAMIPFYRYLVIWSGLYTVHGGFVNWTAEDLGIISFTNELWSERQYDSSRPDGPTPRQRLEFSDYVEFGQTYIPWKKARHPTYGDIELGGFVKMTGRVPPSFHLEELCHRNFAFTVYHADQMPLVELRDVEVKSLGGDLWRVRVDVHNLRSIPTTTAQAAARRWGPRDYVELSAPGAKVLAGGRIADRFNAPFEFVRFNPARLWVDEGVTGDSFQTFQWIVSGRGAGRIRFAGPRVSDVETEIQLAER